MATAIGEICVSASPRASHQGKGAALRDGFARATNDIVIVQDADLEYNPSDYPKLIQPILDDHADVVFGSRFIGGAARRVLYFWHAVGNRVLTALSNLCTNIDLTDMGTGYKVFRLRGRNPTLSGLPHGAPGRADGRIARSDRRTGQGQLGQAFVGVRTLFTMSTAGLHYQTVKVALLLSLSPPAIAPSQLRLVE